MAVRGSALLEADHQGKVGRSGGFSDAWIHAGDNLLRSIIGKFPATISSAALPLVITHPRSRSNRSFKIRAQRQYPANVPEDGTDLGGTIAPHQECQAP